MKSTNALLLTGALCAGLVLGGCARQGEVAASGRAEEPQWIVPLGAGPEGGAPAPKSPDKRASAVFEAATGGTLEADIYRLDVPPWALSYDVEYEIKPSADNSKKVDLEPHGAVFDTPVTLTLDLSGTTAEGAPDITLYWYDDATDTWQDVGGTWDVSTSTLTATLQHFSRYAPGRAGW